MGIIKFRTRSVIITWLISYISVLLVPIIISGIIYTATWHVVASEVNRANESLLNQMEQAIDSNLLDIERLSTEMTLSNRLAGFLDVEAPIKDPDYYTLAGIAKDLRIYKMANDYIEEIYVYYKNSDTVISSREHLDSQRLFEMTYTDGMDKNRWSAIFGKRYTNEYVPITYREDGQASKAVMYARSLTLDNSEQDGAVLLFIIKDSSLLANISSSNKSSIVILDKENRLIAATGNANGSDTLTHEKLTGTSGMFYQGTGKQKIAVSYTASGKTGWKYITIVPAKLFDEKMKLVKNLIYISFILSLFIGGVVTYLFLKRNYNPINTLIRSLVSRSGINFEAGSNEFGYLKTLLDDTFAEKEKIGERFERHRNSIRSHFLQGLLKGQLDGNMPMQESLDVHAIKLASSRFAVLLFSVDHYGKFEISGLIDLPKAKLVHFLVMNVAEEVAEGRHQAYTTEIDNLQACIINFKEYRDEEELMALAEQVKTFMLDHFHVHLTVAVSNAHEQLEGIALAYQEAMTALEYRLVMGSGEIIRYGDLSEATRESRSYYYPLHIEQQLINLIKTGDYDKAKAMLDEIVEINVSGAGMSVPLAKCLIFDLISTILKTLSEIGSSDKRDLMGQINSVDQLFACETIKEMQVQISEVLKKVCDSIQDEKSGDNSRLSQQVIAYVEQRYSSDDLNITALGEAFNLTPSYLSKQFKAQTGEALLEFINKTRIGGAKQLLRTTSLSVSEIAKQVGYSDINTFNRVFKKYEGITPGKYKDML
ncbi:helix-turn-helix domain-containing protein [Paenibacillus sp. PL91]|uniref:helix-turn-helix domain-containing protein n=1 Tax=Paenibacillus sp. PL91 TaxID=2729538 RepID=UPI00145F0020|nr:helix-turn-helix domain-containing protein [Paenibacillus sp. PL91]MBC9200765.1 helix-turn-helix domain-containing protein [Paenibacillus sp. PL91]